MTPALAGKIALAVQPPKKLYRLGLCSFQLSHGQSRPKQAGG